MSRFISNSLLVTLLQLPVDVDLANDPFFGRGGKIIADSQRAQALKFELLIPVANADSKTACLSFNYHMDHFGAIWKIECEDGSVALTMVRSGSAEVLREFSARSGTLMRTIPIGTAQAQRDSPDFCGVLWASADGSDLLTQCGSRQQEVVTGKVTRVKLAWNFLAPQTPVTTFAW